MEPTARAPDSASPVYGLAHSRYAAPAGAASSPSSNSAPTACVPSAATTPSSARKRKPSNRTGTPPPSATPGSTEENSSGRAISSRPKAAASPIAAASHADPALSPRIDPNSTRTPAAPFAPPDDDVVKIDRNSTPRPSTQAN